MKKYLVTSLALLMLTTPAIAKPEKRNFFGDNEGEVTIGLTLVCRPYKNTTVYIDIDFSGEGGFEQIEKFKIIHNISGRYRRVVNRAKEYKFARVDSDPELTSYSWTGLNKRGKTMIATLNLIKGEHPPTGAEKVNGYFNQTWRYFEVAEDETAVRTTCFVYQARERDEKPLKVR